MNDEILERILSDPETRQCPIGTQVTMIHVFEKVLEEKVRENPYATICELLSTTEYDA